jgi:ribosomal protein L7Ae-like RNA K-turn-binding protein
VDAAAEQRLLRMLGLGLRGRLAVAGVDRVREAAHRGRLRVAVVAADASPNSRAKVDALLAAKGVPVIEVPTAAALGMVTGRDATAVIGVVDAQLAKGILALDGPSDAERKGSRRKG